MGFLELLPVSLKKLLGLAEDSASDAQYDAEAEPAPRDPVIMRPRALVVVYDPVVDRSSGRKLTEHMGWNNVDRLIAGYIADIEECSDGMVRYEVVERIDVDAYPIKKDGFRYDTQTFLEVMSRKRPAHDPDSVDYHQILADFDVVGRVDRDEIDELWLFAFPYAGFYESRMAGPGAFFCNAPPLPRTSECSRRFVIMGFNYERGIGEMLEDLGHRAESIMTQVFKNLRGADNLFERFIRYDKVTPGRAEVGNIHFAPNSDRDYDWGNRRFVPSYCDQWLHFPRLEGAARTVNCAEWGNGDIRLHHKWWFKHLPRVVGSSSGVSNNWWKYIIDPNFVASERL